MTETQKRIKAYQELLPSLRERVIAVALLLAMSASMLSSASFAWLTLSRNPEVTAVNTTVAANGNLEIALATGEAGTATPPGESQVGDSSATKGQSVTAANITWGNLVNLADPSYGLDKMVLRPAQLNESSLLDSPLYGATYGKDGRTDRLSSEFNYATWEPADPDKGRMKDSFVVGNKLGVRAITSVIYGESSEFRIQLDKKMYAAQDANTAAGTSYLTLTEGKEEESKKLMGSLAAVMGIYLTDMLNESNSKLDNNDVINLGTIFSKFIGIYDMQIDAMVKLANYQLCALNKGETNYTEYTRDDLMKLSEADLIKKGLKLEGFNTLKKDYKGLLDYYSGTPTKKDTGAIEYKVDADGKFVLDAQGNKQIKENMTQVIARAENGEAIYYGDLEHIVDSLVNVGTCKIVAGGKEYTVNSVGVSSALNILRSSGKKRAIITNGVLKNFEQLNGYPTKIENMKITATYIMTIDITADIETDADMSKVLFQKGEKFAEEIYNNNGGGPREAFTEDTYGLAIDLWTRTNADSSYLTLEGNVLTTGEWVDCKITVNEEIYVVELDGVKTQVYPVTTAGGTQVWYDAKTDQRVDLGNKTPEPDTVENTWDLYVITYSQKDEDTGETVTYDVDVYKKIKPNGDEVWCNAASHAELTAEELKDKTPTQKKEYVETVVGYEGENRIWNQDSDLLSADATTQGSGSCYVYYADNPEDQARSLALLDSFKVAFINANGDLLATASMDTERHYATTGRVIVPLKLDEDRCIILEDPATGDLTYAITTLEKNVPTRITALVYLDGTKLFNENVLAAADIQGRLNIQFGSTTDMEPMRNLELENTIRTVSAKLSRTEFDYDDSGDNLTTTVTVQVDGDEPSTMTAFFLREISSTQGSREEAFTLTQNASGEWVSDYTFTAPGSYVLRSVQLDGIEYDLPLNAYGQPLRATVKGFALESLECTEGKNLVVMTDKNTQTVNLRLKFATTDKEKMPKKVEGRYLREDGTAVNVNFTGPDNSGLWTGKATFVVSGNYTMKYLQLDGNYTPLDSGFWQTADLTLGMRVSVETTSPTQFLYKPAEMTDSQKNLGMEVVILDGEGNEIPSLVGAYLYYQKVGTAELEKGMVTPLTWNNSAQCYEGTFNTIITDPVTNVTKGKIGDFRFHSVEVGKNTLTYATSAPNFKIMSPKPPEFIGDRTPEDRFALNTNATMNVELDAEGASVKAVLERMDKNGKVLGTYEVRNPDDDKPTLVWLDNSGVWNISIPELDSDGNLAADGEESSQDGYWTIKELHVYNAYDANGNAYTADTPLKFINEKYAAEGETGYSFNVSKVISKAEITLDTKNAKVVTGGKEYSWDAELGKTGNTVDGAFLTEYTISGLRVLITDFEGQPLKDGDYTPKVTFHYNYDGKTSDYGGYRSDSVVKTDTYQTVTMNSSDDKTFVQDKAFTIKHAGKYTAVLNCSINGKSCGDVEQSIFDLSVYNEKPNVEIESYLPNGQHQSVAADGSRKVKNVTVTSGRAGNTLTLYLNATGTNGWLGPNITLNEEPQATLKLTGLGNADKATLSFISSTGDTVQMYAGTASRGGTRVDNYTWDSTTGASVTRIFGYIDSGNCSSTTFAGRLDSSDTLIVTDTVNGVETTYNVAVDVITIINNQAT